MGPETCPTCQGFGLIEEMLCPVCEGSGTLRPETDPEIEREVGGYNDVQ